MHLHAKCEDVEPFAVLPRYFAKPEIRYIQHQKILQLKSFFDSSWCPNFDAYIRNNYITVTDLSQFTSYKIRVPGNCSTKIAVRE